MKKGKDEWERMLFAERNRILEFYAGIYVALAAGLWVLSKEEFCDESIEKWMIGGVFCGVHVLFLFLYGIVDRRLRMGAGVVGSQRFFGYKNITLLGYIAMALGLVIVVAFLYQAPLKNCSPR